MTFTAVLDKIAEVRKFLIVLVPAVGIAVGTDNPGYLKALAFLVALGVYQVPNKPKA